MGGGSEMLLAANHGNKYSIAIEVASSPLVDHDLWEEFKEAIADNWGNYRDRSGNLLRVRPHWAKEFPRKVGGVPINDYMRQIYSTQLPAYVQGMRRLVEEKNDGDLLHPRHVQHQVYGEHPRRLSITAFLRPAGYP